MRLAVPCPVRFTALCGVLLWAVCGVACGQGSDDAGRERARRFVQERGGSAQALEAARRQHLAMLAAPRISPLTAAWSAVGPGAVASLQYGNVSGRVTAIAIDPADATGNTVYVGTTGGGVWKSTNAAGAAGSVVFTPLTDTLSVFASGGPTTASLSIGALAIGNGVLLAGTGDANDATDSYYGAGILRSADGGTTWTLAQQSLDGVAGNHSVMGLSVAGLAFSSVNPSLVVAGFAQDPEGTVVNATDANVSTQGLYWSSDAGVTWHMASIYDASQAVQTPQPGASAGNAVTSVVWNPVRQMFYAAVRYHGYYQSADGMTWLRLSHQPGAGLTVAACPTDPGTIGSSGCPIFRGALAAQPVTGDLFALTVDAQDRDAGLYQDSCGLKSGSCSNAGVTFATALNGAPLEQGSGSSVIAQGSYDLELAAVASGADTLLYAGTVDLYRCSLAAGCSLRNTTNAENGCTTPALVAPSQHAIAALGGLVYLGNDGGLWRSTDGVSETGAACSSGDASHFQNLNGGLGSLAEVISFAQAPADSAMLLAGLGALGTAGTSTVTNNWAQLSEGEGGTVAIDQANPMLWYLSNGAGVSVARCAKGAACTSADFAATAIGAAQTANDTAALHPPWLLDPGFDTNLIAGTCRVWRGPATGGALWSNANTVSPPLGAQLATACSSTAPIVRSLAAGGAAGASSNAQNAGSEVLYAGMAGVLDGGAGVPGHLFVTTTAQTASGTVAWADTAKSTVANDVADAGVFNPGGFDISSIAVDVHDATGATVYATVMGFTNNGINAPHVYRSTDAGGHWTNISSNLPNAPANSVIVDPNDANTLYVALDTGIYVTTQVTSCTAANCWSVYGTALPNAPVVQLQAAAAMATGDGRIGELRAATYGRGIWQIPLLTAAAPAAPAMSISPSAVTFTSEPVGTASAYVPVTITNTGNAGLMVSSVTTTGDFNETTTCTGGMIAQNATCTVQVRFLPSATGARSGVLTVYGNVAGGQATAALSGTGLAPAAVVLSPVSLVFPTTGVAATSAMQNVTVSNTGGVAVSLQSPTITGDFTISANTCGTSLGAGVGCTVSIVFAPTASGARSGTLTIVDGVGTQTASLSGTGANPATDTLAPLSLSFGAQQLNTTSTAQQITLTNAGDLALTLISAQVTAGDFSVTSSCGNSLAAHAVCALSVTYIPKSVGAGAGSLTVTDQFRSQTVQLSGTGLAPPGVSLSPVGGLAFGVVGVGLSTSAQMVTLTNNGGVPLALASVVATGDYTLPAGGNTCGVSLAPAGACTVQVVFSPTATGVRPGTVTFTDNAANSPQTVALSGTGIDFTLAANGPSTMTIASGQTATYQLLLGSAGGLPGSVAFTCAGVPHHASCTVNPSSAALGGNTSITVTIATGLAIASVRLPEMPWSERVVWLATLLPCAWLLRRRRRLPPALLGCVLLLSACGTARTIPNVSAPSPTVYVTPSGTSTIVVAGSSAGLVRTVNLTLVVQ